MTSVRPEQTPQVLKYLHCNKCFRDEPIAESQYWLSNCGHVLCQKCVKRGRSANRDKTAATEKEVTAPINPDASDTRARNDEPDTLCPVCKATCACIKVPKDVTNLPVQIQPFFQSLQELCRIVLDASKFQEDNMYSLVDHLKSKTARQSGLLKKALKELQRKEEAKTGLEELSAENQRLKAMIKVRDCRSNSAALQSQPGRGPGSQRQHRQSQPEGQSRTKSERGHQPKTAEQGHDVQDIQHESKVGTTFDDGAQSVFSNASHARARQTLQKTPAPPARLSLLSSPCLLSRHPSEIPSVSSHTLAHRRLLPTTQAIYPAVSHPTGHFAMAQTAHASTSSQHPRTAGHLGYMTQQTPVPGPVPPNKPTTQAIYSNYTSKPQAPQAPQAFIPYQIPEPVSNNQAYRPLSGQYASRIIGSVGQAPGYHRVLPSSGPLVQDGWIHTRNNAASSVRTAWQHQRLRQPQQQQTLQQDHLQQQVYPQQQVYGQSQQFQRVQQPQQQPSFPGASSRPYSTITAGPLDPRYPRPQIQRRL